MTIDDMGRELFTVLAEFKVGDDPTFRKRLARRLAEEGVTVAELRRACQRMNTVDGWVRAVLRLKKRDPMVNMPMDPEAEKAKAEAYTRAYAVERVAIDGKTADEVAAQLGIDEATVAQWVDEEAHRYG
jgi:transposase-like protein